MHAKQNGKFPSQIHATGPDSFAHAKLIYVKLLELFLRLVL